MTSNIKDISNFVKKQLPQYLANDSEYENFIKFLELYYEWLSTPGNISEVTSNIIDYGDIDKTLDLFVDLYKSELAAVWPNIVKIKGGVQTNIEYLQQENSEVISDSSTETIMDQEFFADGVTPKFKLNYFDPIYYLGDANADTRVINIRVFSNAAGSDRGVDTSLAGSVEYLTDPDVNPNGSTGSYTELTQNTDYTLENNTITFIDNQGAPLAPTNNDLIKVRFLLRTNLQSVSVPSDTDAVRTFINENSPEKTSYSNRKNFFKFLKDFYKSKGSEKSYEFLFRALFNEPIEVYYPKEYVFKSSNNTWSKTKSLRTIPYVKVAPTDPVIQSPYEIEGKSSGATALIENYAEKTIGTYSVREYFVSNIVGTFTSKEKIKIKQTDGTSYEEELYECITGFEIVNAGSNYPRNMTLGQFVNSQGSGTGFSAFIDHTTYGPIENVELVGKGTNYITGESIIFDNTPTLGTGAAAEISDIESVESSFEVVFNQDPESNNYPFSVFDISSSGNNFDSNAGSETVSIENIDLLSNNVIMLYDYEAFNNNYVQYSNGVTFGGYYIDKTNNTFSLRQKAPVMDVSNPTSQIINYNSGEVTETRIRNDLEIEISSVNNSGGITGLSISNLTANPTSIFPSSVSLTGQSAGNENSLGFGALFDIEFNSGTQTITSLSLSSDSQDQMYSVGDIIRIDGRLLNEESGISGQNDINIEITAISGGQVVTNIDSNNYTTTSLSGSGAIWDVDTTATTYPRLVSVILDGASATTGYKVGDQFTILGSLLGGTDVTHDLIITVTEVEDNGAIPSNRGAIVDFDTFGRAQTGQISTFQVLGTPTLPTVLDTFRVSNHTITHPSGTVGTGAIFTVKKVDTEYSIQSPAFSDQGSGYLAGSTVTISGSELGGVDGTHNLVLNIDSVNSSGRIISLSKTSGTGLDSKTLTSLPTNQNIGSGAKFNIDISNGNYSVSVATGNEGSGYGVGQKLIIPGLRLSNQWVKDGFAAGLSKVGAKALFTNLGYSRVDNIQQLLAENLTDSELTIDFWYFRKSISVTNAGIPGGTIFSFNELSNGTQKTILYQKSDGTLQLNNSGSDVLTTSILPFGVWHHIAIHFSSSSTTIYVDGEKESSIASNMLEVSTNPTSFYVGARQVVGASYSVGDYTTGFFGTMRFTKGSRYEEQATSPVTIEDKGTDNVISGNGLNPKYVNPIPSVEFIRKSSTQTLTFTATAETTSSYSFDYDEDQAVIVQVNGAVYTAFTATTGSAITFTSPLTIGDSVVVTFYASLADNIEYVIYDSTHPVVPNKIFLRKNDPLTGIFSTYQLSDGFSLRLKYTSRPPDAIKSIRLLTGGGGYVSFPTAYVAEKTLNYTSQGVGGFFIGKGSSIGGISKISIYNHPVLEDQEGFGVAYDTAPTLDLSSIGDGNAQVNVLTGPLCIREGAYVNEQGFLSGDNRITDSYLWQDYSYVIKVGRFIDEWRKIVKKVVHPAGLMMFGEYSISTTARRSRRVLQTWQQLLYEIIKNVNVKVRNMDGLGRWTWPAGVDTHNINNLNSHGIKIVYDNRQETINSEVNGVYQGVGAGEVSDDTSGSATSDNGSGRYALLNFENGIAVNWGSVSKIAMNHLDAYGKDYEYYYTSEVIGNTITVYDISDTEVTDDEYLNTRPYAKYRVTSVESFSNVTDKYVVFNVEMIMKYSTLPTLSPNNKVEFRWDNVWRGNVDRSPNYWIGAVADGANPRDEKMIINISGRYNNKEGDVPTLHTTWKSLERFKFYFTAFYPWENLAPVLASPVGELINSPYWKLRKLVQGNSLTHVTRKSYDNKNIWYFMPIEEYSDEEYIANTDGTDHNWTNTRISEISEKYDRKYRAVLDSVVNITPVYLVISEEEPNSKTRKRMGPTNLSIERTKFNEKLQAGLDYNLNATLNDFTDDLLDKNNFTTYSQSGDLHGKTNYAPESSIIKYTNSPQTITELNNILNSVLVD